MPAVVQHRSTFSTGVTSVSLAFLSNNAASNLLVYASGVGDATAMSAATDNNTNTIANATNPSAAAGSSRVDYVANSNSGANTVTGHYSFSQDIHLHIWEISGCVTSSPVRASGTVLSSATASVSTSTTTPLSGDAVFGFFLDGPSNAPLTAGAGYSPSELTSNGTNGNAAISEYKTATGGGTQTATCGGNGADLLSQSIVVFIQAAASFVPDEDFWQGPMPPPIDPNIILWQ